LGICSVREVYVELNKARATGYTTALKLMQIMTEKGLVRRQVSGRAHLYEAIVSQQGTQGWLIRDLAERAFGGSAAELVQRALSETPASTEQLARIKQIIAELEDRKG
jgi:predicted transcriptional regulator